MNRELLVQQQVEPVLALVLVLDQSELSDRAACPAMMLLLVELNPTGTISLQPQGIYHQCIYCCSLLAL